MALSRGFQLAAPAASHAVEQQDGADGGAVLRFHDDGSAQSHFPRRFRRIGVRGGAPRRDGAARGAGAGALTGRAMGLGFGPGAAPGLARASGRAPAPACATLFGP